MKKRWKPLQVPLRELPAEGEELKFTNDSGEMNEVLKDLVGDNAYTIQLRITPQGNAYELRGQVETHLNLLCSRCAMDLKWPVKLNLHEVIVVDKPMHKGDQMSRVNHAHEWQEDGPDFILLNEEVFDVGEYIHEMIALAEPMRPLGKPDCDVSCENWKNQVQRSWLSYGEDGGPSFERPNPFRILEKFKLKS